MSLSRFYSTMIKVSPQSRDFSSNFAVTWWEFGWGCWTEREVFSGKVGVGRVVVDRRKGLLGLWGKRERERHLKVTFWLDDRKRGKGALGTGEGLGLDRQAPHGEELPAPCGSWGSASITRPLAEETDGWQNSFFVTQVRHRNPNSLTYNAHRVKQRSIPWSGQQTGRVGMDGIFTPESMSHFPWKLPMPCP